MTNWEKVLVDGKSQGTVKAMQITYADDCKKATIVYTTDGANERTLTCELEAISFGA